MADRPNMMGPLMSENEQGNANVVCRYILTDNSVK